MSGGIFLLRGEDELVPMTEAPYDTEEVLQALLARFRTSWAATSSPAARAAGC